VSDTIDDSQVRHIAELARLDLTPDEAARHRQELGRILEYFGQLSAVDITGVEPLAHPLPICNVWEADEIRDSIPQEAALENAPDRRGPFFALPRVLDDSGA